jgi:hypothetical protein
MSNTDSSLDSVRKTLDKYHSTISTTGHVVNYLQNQRIMENQARIVEAGLIQASVLDEQNRLKEKELSLLKKELKAIEKERSKAEKKQKRAAYLVSLGPKCEDIIELIQSPEIDTTFRGMLIKHLELTLQMMDEEKSDVIDVSFQVFIRSKRKQLEEIRREHRASIEEFASLSAAIEAAVSSIRYLLFYMTLEIDNARSLFEKYAYDTGALLVELRDALSLELDDNNLSASLTVVAKTVTLFDELENLDELRNSGDYDLYLSYSQLIEFKKKIGPIHENLNVYKTDCLSKIDKCMRVVGEGAYDKLKKLQEVLNLNKSSIYERNGLIPS